VKNGIAVTGPFQNGGRVYLITRPVSIRSEEVMNLENNCSTETNICRIDEVKISISRSHSISDKTNWKSSTEIGLELSTKLQFLGNGVEASAALKVSHIIILTK
jgi:hypothetical protein